MSVTPPFTVLGDRVVIQADVEDRAPEPTESGLILAKTLAAAVDGADRQASWFQGTVVAVGSLVNRFDIRPYVIRRLREGGLTPEEVERLPMDCPEPLQIGDRCCFSWAAGQEILVDGDKYLILRASEVLALLPADEAA